MPMPRVRAVTFTAPRRAELLELPEPASKPGPGEVAGPTLASLISAGTEINDGFDGTRFPREMGYASVFRAELVGEGVGDVQPGELLFCMGSHRSWQCVPRNRTLVVPAGLDPSDATFARLMGVSMTTLTTTTARPNDRVLVTGLGLVGHMAALVFGTCGYRITAVDPDPARRDWLRSGGVPDVRESVPAETSDLCGEVALVLECSGHDGCCLDAVRLVKKGGEVALIGAPWRAHTDTLAQTLTRLIFFRYITVRSGWEWELPLQPTEFRRGSIFGNYAAALDWLATGRITAAGLYRSTSPADAQSAYSALQGHQWPALAAVFDWAPFSTS